MGKWIAVAVLLLIVPRAHATPPEWLSRFVGQMDVAATTCELQSNLRDRADAQALALVYATRGTAPAAVPTPSNECATATTNAEDGFNAASRESGQNAAQVKSAHAAWLTYMDAIGSTTRQAQAQAKLAYQQAVNELYVGVGDQ